MPQSPASEGQQASRPPQQVPVVRECARSSPSPDPRPPAPGPRPGRLLRLGRVEYQAAWDLQRDLVAARKAGEIPDTLILLEHPHTYTLGRSADPAHLLADPATLERIGAVVLPVDRGGDITYHGPGQLVGYPIVQLRNRGNDVRQYVRDLEEVLIRTLDDLGIVAGRDAQHPGVWVGEAKVAALGVRVSGGVTSHGFAFNVDPDLAYFGQIVPCGIHDRQVVSVARLLSQSISMEAVVPRVVAHFAEVFGLELTPAP